MTDPHDLGAVTVSMLLGLDGPIRAEVEALAASLAAGPRPDVVLLSNAMLVGVARGLGERLGAPVACTLQGEEPFLDALPAPHREAAWDALRTHARDVRRFLAVSAAYGAAMADRLALSSDRLRVVWNGIDVDDLAPAETAPAAPTIGYLARMSREKGLETLVDAFLRIEEPADVRLRIAGVRLAGDVPFVDSLLRRVEAAGRGDRVDVRPNVSREEKARFLRSLSVLSVPATVGESFGLYLLEAWACGVPVVQPRHAAFPELVEATGGGVLCAPDDPADLAAALSRLLSDEPERARLGAAGREAVLDRFTSDAMAARVEEALDAL
ncbi:MAG: glycosyltransferase family 4 protein [Planctomycetota bacterium JB042]